MRAFLPYSVIVGLALTPATAAAQVVSGIAFERGDPAHRVGVQVGGTLGVDLTSRLALQFEATHVAFGKTLIAPTTRPARRRRPVPPPVGRSVSRARACCCGLAPSICD